MRASPWREANCVSCGPDSMEVKVVYGIGWTATGWLEQSLGSFRI